MLDSHFLILADWTAQLRYGARSRRCESFEGSLISWRSVEVFARSRHHGTIQASQRRRIVRSCQRRQSCEFLGRIEGVVYPFYWAVHKPPWRMDKEVIIFDGWAQRKRRKFYFSYQTSMEKNFSLPTQLEKFSWAICHRACAVFRHSWFSHLHGPSSFFPWNIFPTRPSPFIRCARWVLFVRLAEVCFDFWFFLVACAGFSHQLVGHAGCKCRELRLVR